MKRIPADVAKVALGKGVTIIRGGQVVNADGRRVTLTLPKPAAGVAFKPPPEPAKPAAEAAPKAPPIYEEARREREVAAIIRSALAEVRAQQSAPSPAPIVEWEFTIERDSRTDLITKVRAFAIREGSPQ